MTNVVDAETKSALPIWVPLWGGFCGTWATVFEGTRSDMLTSVRRIGAYSSTSATNFTGTGRATHIRFRW